LFEGRCRDCTASLSVSRKRKRGSRQGRGIGKEQSSSVQSAETAWGKENNKGSGNKACTEIAFSKPVLTRVKGEKMVLMREGKGTLAESNRAGFGGNSYRGS